MAKLNIDRIEDFHEIIRKSKAGGDIIGLLTHEFVGDHFVLQYFPTSETSEEDGFEIGGMVEGWALNRSTKTITLISGALCMDGFLNPFTFNLTTHVWTMQLPSPQGGSMYTQNLRLVLY